MGGGRTAMMGRSRAIDKGGGRTMGMGRRRKDVAASKCTREEMVDGIGGAAVEGADGGGQGRREFDPEQKME